LAEVGQSGWPDPKYGIAVGSAVAVICGGEFERRKQEEQGKQADPMTPPRSSEP
jgi:hypothetical protein